MRQDSLLAGRAQCMYGISSTHTRTCKTTSTLVHASIILHLKIWYQLSNRFTHPTWVRSRRGRICDIQLYYHVVLGLLLPLYLNVSLHLPLSLSLCLFLCHSWSLIQWMYPLCLFLSHMHSPARLLISLAVVFSGHTTWSSVKSLARVSSVVP